MATVQSDAVVSGITPDHARAGGVLNRIGEYIVTTTALSANDVIEMVPIPASARIVDMKVGFSGANNDSTLDVGDASDVDRFFDGLPTGMLDNKFTQFADGTTNGFNYKYTAQDTIDIKVLTNDLDVGTRLDLNVQYVIVGTIDDEV